MVDKKPNVANRPDGEGVGVNRLKGRLWNMLHAGWKPPTLDPQEALLLNKSRLGISVLAGERHRDTVTTSGV